MRAISGKWSGRDSTKTTDRTARYLYCGVATGVIAGLATLAATTTSFAVTNGCEPVNCAVFGSTMTVMLSQPAALVGALVGAVCGGVCAMISRHVHHN